MPNFENARQLLQRIREQLDEWVLEGREEAYQELFEGPDARLTDEELRELDRIDSRLSRERGDGLWGADEYAILPAGVLEEESTPHVVCTYHPQIPAYVNRGEAPLEEERRGRLNDAMWEYCQRVVELVQKRLEEFVWSSDVETWAE